MTATSLGEYIHCKQGLFWIVSRLFPDKATFKHVTKALAEVTESSENGSGNGSDSPSTGGGTSGSGSTTGGDNNGGENTDPED